MASRNGRASGVPGAARLRERLDRAVRIRVEGALQPVRDRLDRQGRRLDRLERAVAGEPGGPNRVTFALNQLGRLEARVAAIEERLEDLRERLGGDLDPGTDEDRAEARHLLDEVRREHRQVRARMTAISWYEDRLRQLETAVGAPGEGTG